MRLSTNEIGIGGTPPEAIIFDLDGTLYDLRFLKPLLGIASFPYWDRLAALAAARESKAGVDFGSRRALLDALTLDASLRLNGLDPDSLRVWYEEYLYGKFIGLLRRHYRARSCVRRFLDARKKAPRADLPLLAVLSDYGHIDDRLHAIGLDPRQFDVLLSSEDEGALKPSPGPFLRAAELLGARAERTLVVGDRDDTDGAGAEAAGMAFVRVSTPREARAFFCGLTGN